MTGTDGKAELLWPEKEIVSLRQQVGLWKSAYLEQVELHNKTLDDLAIAERELAALKPGEKE